MATYLDEILRTHRARAARDDRSLESLIARASMLPNARGFRRALVERSSLAGGDDTIAVISEIKRRSPSKGELATSLDPAFLARSYERGGAACLSVLTDSEHFGGSVDDLRMARAACGLPVLRKDFTVDSRDVCDARLMGGDCVLLIAAALDDRELLQFHSLATEIGIDALVEVHDQAELERALAVGAVLVGVNQRDLATFEVDAKRAFRLAGAIPEGIVRVAESGIRGPDDARALAAAGYHAVLVGEALVTSGDPERAVAELRSRC